MTAPLLDVRDLTVRFDTWEGTVHAVTGVTYALQPGEPLLRVEGLTRHYVRAPN